MNLIQDRNASVVDSLDLVGRREGAERDSAFFSDDLSGVKLLFVLWKPEPQA